MVNGRTAFADGEQLLAEIEGEPDIDEDVEALGEGIVTDEICDL